MIDCLFCKIAGGQRPAKIIYRSSDVVAFHDISPQAPTHILVIPVKHIASAREVQSGDADLIGRMITAAVQIAKEQNLDRGYRFVINTGSDGGQSVDHLHIHILGGRQMRWPPG
jgi:histidine triad (HIT) family protein